MTRGRQMIVTLMEAKIGGCVARLTDRLMIDELYKFRDMSLTEMQVAALDDLWNRYMTVKDRPRVSA